MSSRKKAKRRKSRADKYEDCVLKVKAKQPKHCFSGSFRDEVTREKKWKDGKGCYNPWAICTKSVGRPKKRASK